MLIYIFKSYKPQFLFVINIDLYACFHLLFYNTDARRKLFVVGFHLRSFSYLSIFQTSAVSWALYPFFKGFIKKLFVPPPPWRKSLLPCYERFRFKAILATRKVLNAPSTILLMDILVDSIVITLFSDWLTPILKGTGYCSMNVNTACPFLMPGALSPTLSFPRRCVK